MAAKAQTGSKPLTIRRMLLWLYGLEQDEQKQHKTKLEEYITRTLPSQLKGKFSSTYASITRVANGAKKLVDEVCRGAGKIIVGIQKGEKYSNNKQEHSSELYKLKQELKDQPLLYESEDEKLYQQFFYYITCSFWQLRFLCLKCYTQSGVGGWGQCQYGNGVSLDSKECKSTEKGKKDGQPNHEQRCGRCSQDYKACLMAFLTDGSEQKGMPPEENIYKDAKYSCTCHTNSSCPVPPIGFPKDKLPELNKAAKDLKTILDDFINDHTKPFPKLLGHLLILQLLESSSSTTLKVPSTWGLPHHFAFWTVFRQKWSKNGQKNTQFKDGWNTKFTAELNGNGHGTHIWKRAPGAPDTLLDALFKMYNSSEHNNSQNHNSLLTLTSCEVNNGASETHCGKYFHGLLELPFQTLVEEFKAGGLFADFMNHKTIKEFAEKFHQNFQAFQQKLQNQTCVTQQSACTCIVHCDDTHSCMYQHGITFNSSTNLAVINKGITDTKRNGAPQRTCSDLKNQLDAVLRDDAPLYKLTKIGKILSPDKIKELFKDVLKQLADVTARAAAAGVITTARFLNAHHSSLIEPPCNVKECIDWLIRLGELDIKRLTGNNHSSSYYAHRQLTENSMGLEKAIKALTGPNLITDIDIKSLIEKLSHFIGYNNGEVNGSGIATASYYSAYRMSAQWPVCGKGQQCSSCKNMDCKCSTASASKASSCDGQCCDTCDARTCARIFLLIVPVLRNVLMYLYGKCNITVKGKTGHYGQWALQSITGGTNGNGKYNATDLKNFMELCGFKTDKLSDKTGFTLAEQQEGTLTLLGGALNIVHTGIHKALQHKNESSKKFLRDGNKNGTGPKTIAEVCLWLYFLPYCTNYKKVVKELKTNANKFNGIKDEFTIHLQTTVSQFTTLFNVIEGSPSGGNSLFQRIATLCRGEHIFQYPQPQHLLKDLGLYVYKVHTQLRFLMVMCNTDKDKGGWKECEYTGNGQQTSVVQPSDYGSLTCQCGGSSGPGSSVPAAVTCPLLLRAFLTNGNEPKRQEQNGNVFKLYQNASGDKEEHYQMGFSIFSSTTTPAQGALPTLTGKDIYNFLKDLVDDIPRPPAQSSPSPSTPSKPLSLLTQHCVAIGPVQPESLGDLFAFFAHLGTKWQSLTLYNNAGVFKEKLTVELNDYQIGNEGTDKSCGELQKKIKAIIPTTHSTHDIKDLMSLMCTNGHTNNDNCSPYMKSLSQGVYHYYCPKIQDSDPQQNKFTMLQYLYDMLRKLLDGMKKLKGAFDKCDCCKNTGSSSCQGLISCPYAHPILYKFGFVFGEPGSLSKKCTDIKAQLGVVLQCEKDQESVLFSAFECVIQVTYKVLLEKAKGCVTTKAQALQNSFFNNRNGDKEQWEKAFYNYVTNAMYISYPKLICTFACKLFNGEHDCNTNKCSDFEVPGPPPNPKISRSLFPTLEVTKSNVTLISPIIPQYTAPHIDCYHYKTFNKQSGAQAKVEQKTENTYGFRDAIDFHIQGAQCILPVPSNLRSAVDWMLRVTVGVADGKNNDNNNQLSEAVKSVLGAGVPVTGDTEAVQKNVTDLVQGLRKFVGYEDRSENVKTSVTTLLGDGQSNNGVKGALQKKIEKMHGYLNGEDQFGTEMGRALLKGRYEVQSNGVVGALFDTARALVNLVDGVITGDIKRGRTLAEVVTTLQSCLTHIHTCQTGLNCTNFKATKSVASTFSSGTVTADGLKLLECLFNCITVFSNDGEKYRRTGVILYVENNARNKTEQHNSTNDQLGPGFFEKFFTVLSMLGQCATQVSEFKTNDYLLSSTQVRTKIDALIKALKPATENLNDDDVKKISSACDVYMRVIHKESERLIVNQIRQNIELECYEKQKDRVVMNKLLAKMHTVVSSRMDAFMSHLDDLKRLCQWLYRMSQLYASGLKGFVESLVSHLEHIAQVIDWITGIERMLRGFGQECVSTAEGLITVDDLNCIPVCCHRHKRDEMCEASVPTALCEQKMACPNGIVTDTSSSSTETNTCVLSPSVFFDALNCRIDNLLSSYVLGPLPGGTITQNDSVCSQGEDTQSPSAPGATTTPSASDRSCHFRAFLERLRLLALDRYTLEIWEDNKDCIRYWNVFKNGIVRHSDLEGIKRALGCLTLMEDYRDIKDLKGVRSSSDCSLSFSLPSSSAPPSAPQRIHDFHAICVIQKFSFEAPLRALQCSIQGLQKIEGCLQKCNEGLQPLQKLLKRCDCHCRGVTSCEDQCQQSCKQECLKDILSVCSQDCSSATPFCELYCYLCEFLCEPYGVFNLAQFLHTILGPNAFSAVICSLRDLKDILCRLFKEGIISEPKGALQDCKVSLPSNKDVSSLSCAAVPCRLMRRLCSIVSILNGRNALRALKDTVSTVTTAQCNVNDDCYGLDSVTRRLQAFVDVLKREYIFAYPVVCGIEFDKDCKAVCPGECDTECSSKSKDASLACSLTPATSTVSLTSSLPLLCVHCHTTASICQECIPLLARIFITLVPVLYPQLCYLAYQCRLYWQQDHMNGYKDSALRSLMRTFGFKSKDLYDYLYVDVPFTGTHIYKVLNKDNNSLRLLCDNFTKDTDAFPFNEASPFHRLYTQCLQYYRCRKNERLTDSKSTTPVMPTSLRQILRFFVYLPFSSQFDALQCIMQRYCSQSCVVNFSDLFTTMMMSSAMSAVLLQLIECPQGAFLRFFDDIYTNKEGLYLDNNTESLFYQLCDLSVTLYRSLKFLSLQCGTERSLAGWRDCRLRGVKGNKESEDTERKDSGQLQLCASHLCECLTAGAKGVTTATPMCLNAGLSATAPSSKCLFPLLRYLTDAAFFDSTLTVPNALRKVCLNDSCQEMTYRNMAPRGWEKELLQCARRERQHKDSQLRDTDQKACSSVCHSRDSDPQRSDLSNCCSHPCCRAQCSRVMCSTLYGHHLFRLLSNFVGHEFDADPLLQFTRYMVSIAAWPPDSLSGYMTFMLRFSDWLRRDRNTVSGSLAHGNTSQKKDLNSSVLRSLMSEITLFPGEFDPNCLIDAFLKVTHCEHNNGVALTVPSPSTATSSSFSPSPLCPTSSVTISVLRDCKDCKCIIYPLDYEIYDLHLPMYARRYLTWMLHFGPRLHRGMRALEKEFKRHIEDSASQSGICATDTGLSGSRTSVQCHASVLRCPFALPELHSAGLHFRDPKGMCSVSCQCLVERLQCSIQDSSPLAEFLRQCDSFLWSVRKPFYWLTMALWIVATVYLLFVHFWRLDSWRLLSHVIRSRASHLVYPKVLLAAELDHSYERYYAPR